MNGLDEETMAPQTFLYGKTTLRDADLVVLNIVSVFHYRYQNNECSCCDSCQKTAPFVLQKRVLIMGGSYYVAYLNLNTASSG